MVDAGMRAIELLKERPGPRSRVLVFIGQPVESDSGKIEALEANAERENVQICALTLPVVGKAFVSDSFSLQGLGSQWYRGGVRSERRTDKGCSRTSASCAGERADRCILFTNGRNRRNSTPFPEAETTEERDHRPR